MPDKVQARMRLWAVIFLGLALCIVFYFVFVGGQLAQKESRDTQTNQARIIRLEQRFNSMPSTDTTQTPYKETQVKIYGPKSVEWELGIKRESWTKYYSGKVSK